MTSDKLAPVSAWTVKLSLVLRQSGIAAALMILKLARLEGLRSQSEWVQMGYLCVHRPEWVAQDGNSLRSRNHDAGAKKGDICPKAQRRAQPSNLKTSIARTGRWCCPQGPSRRCSNKSRNIGLRFSRPALVRWLLSR